MLAAFYHTFPVAVLLRLTTAERECVTSSRKGMIPLAKYESLSAHRRTRDNRRLSPLGKNEVP